MDNSAHTNRAERSSLLRTILGIMLVGVLFFAAGYAFGRFQGTEPSAPEPIPAPLIPPSPTTSPDSPESPESPASPSSPESPETPDTPEPAPDPATAPGTDYGLVFYPAQTDVDEDDVYVYGRPVGVPSSVHVEEDGEYTSMEEVSLYIHLYGHVPPNFVSKTKARRAGWIADQGNLQDVLPGMSIGGGGWHNDERVMPGSPDDQWFECDIDYEGGYRNAQRLVYSDNGMIFYTEDHYESFARIF